MSASPLITLPNKEATALLGQRLAECLRPGDIVLLEGELGAGKTFLARAIARALGVPEHVPVTSPTFSLIHELSGRFPVFHADLYRLADPAELRELGLLEGVADHALLIVEWGERFEQELGEVALISRLSIAGPGVRTAQLTARSPRGEEILACLEARPGGWGGSPC